MEPIVYAMYIVRMVLVYRLLRLAMRICPKKHVRLLSECILDFCAELGD